MTKEMKCPACQASGLRVILKPAMYAKAGLLFCDNCSAYWQPGKYNQLVKVG